MEARIAAHAITVSTRRVFLTDHPLLKSAAHLIPHARITALSTIQLYAIDGDVSPHTLEKLRDMVTHPITEEGTINSVSATRTTTCAFVVGFLPGVTDNVGKTVESLLADIDPRAAKQTRIYSSTLYCIEGDCSQEDAARLAGAVFNPVIQYAKVLTHAELAHFMPIPARVALHETGTYTVVALRTLSDEALTQLGKQGIPNTDGTTRGPLALSLHDMKTIQAYFIQERRDPTDVELESIAQTWSEHCKHTIFSDPIGDISEGIYRTYIKGATQYIRKKKGAKDTCVSVFSDNAGGISFTKEYLVTHKVETHNSPSALDPFGGAITGIVGVNRDTLGFGLGAKPIANVYGFCVGHPQDETMYYRAPHKGNPLLSAERILNGVVKGVGSGGNESGIPTPVGFVSVDARYRGKPLVFAGTVGLIPRRIGKKLSHKKAAQAGDYVVVAGGRVGLDGIHGATFSSEALESGSPATAVQIGDPITQKKLSDAMLTELRDAGLYTSVTDNGAGGISCSVAEMAKECGGASVDLTKVPTKYPGLAPWQIWISESQERMTFSVPKRSWKAFERIMKRYGAEAAIIGTFTEEKRCTVTVGKRTVMNLSMQFLHNGRIPRTQVLQEPARTVPVPMPRTARNHKNTILALLQTPGVGSYLPITEQYDHEVQATSVTKPVQGSGRVNADSGVLQPLRTSERGIVLSASLRHSRTPKDAYAFSALAIDEAIRSAVAAGASLESIALLDNYCWSSSTQPERLWELVQSTKACYDIATGYLTPFISGKDSMFNDFRGYTAAGEPIHIAAPPTLLISAIGQIDSIMNAQTLDVKQSGDSIFLIGATEDALALSEYMVHSGARPDTVYAGAKLPNIRPKEYAQQYRTLERCIKKGFVNAAYAPNRGGIAVALLKMALAGNRGIAVRIPHVVSEESSLFSECGGRIVVTVPERHVQRFIAACKSVPCTKLGVVTEGDVCVLTTRAGDVRISLTEARTAYTQALTL
jgi:phosphoribosylformylglycinamidine synthase subunit PurSL